MSTEVDAFLEHFGTKGMKWGRRQGKSVTGVSRSSGAIIDRNDRIINEVKKTQSGEKNKVADAIVKKVLGPDQQKRNQETLVSSLTAQNARLKSGKTTFNDKLDKFMNVSVGEMFVSARPRT